MFSCCDCIVLPKGATCLHAARRGKADGLLLDEFTPLPSARIELYFSVDSRYPSRASVPVVRSWGTSHAVSRTDIESRHVTLGGEQRSTSTSRAVQRARH